MKTVYITCAGCPKLINEVRRVKILAEKNGYNLVDAAENANCVIFAGCANVDFEEAGTLQRISEIIKKIKSETTEIIIYGCVAAIAETTLKKMGNFTIIKPDQEERFNEILPGSTKIEDVVANIKDTEDWYSVGMNSTFCMNRPMSATRKNQRKMCEFLDKEYKTTSFTEAFDFCNIAGYAGVNNGQIQQDIFEIKIGSGCAQNCSFCVENMHNGKVKSVSIEKILDQINNGIKLGFRKFYLISLNSGDYGKDTNDDLCNLLDKIAQTVVGIKPTVKLFLPFLYPNKLISSYERLLPHFQSGLIYCATVSIQTGSKKIMRLMERNTDLPQFKLIMQDIHKKNLPTFFHTDIIVGFPGETMEDFHATMELLESVHYDSVIINPFSARPGTPAAKFKKQIPQNEIFNRYKIMGQYCNLLRSHQLMYRITHAFAKSTGHD